MSNNKSAEMKIPPGSGTGRTELGDSGTGTGGETDMPPSSSSSAVKPPGPVEDPEEESEVLEESPAVGSVPAGRWQKRREEVQQRDVPLIDCAFLAMDTEEGVEVVWNEVRISEKKSSKVQIDKIKQVFDSLIELEHPNIAKFHKYWTDNPKDRLRVVFITEYMSSGSLRQFLKKTKKSNRNLKAWKRWCTQILSALSYLHSHVPPLVHGNLTTDTIFIQHNGLIKIGSVAPEAIYSHVKTYKTETKNLHYIAPENLNKPDSAAMTPAVDIYAFGICALEMAAQEISVNGDTVSTVSSVGDDVIRKVLDSVDDAHQKNFIERCLEQDPQKRPTARELLFHCVLFEVHSLKLLSSHAYIKNSKGVMDDISSLSLDVNRVIAEIPNKPQSAKQTQEGSILELQKFLIDVRNGVYPLTAFNLVTGRETQGSRGARAATPEQVESVKQDSEEQVEAEARLVMRHSCQITRVVPNTPSLQMTLLLCMDDQMNRQLTCEFNQDESASTLVDELVLHGFINIADRDKIAGCIEDGVRQMTCLPSAS